MRKLMVSKRAMPSTTASVANISVQATAMSVTTAFTTTSFFGPQMPTLVFFPMTDGEAEAPLVNLMNMMEIVSKTPL